MSASAPVSASRVEPGGSRLEELQRRLSDQPVYALAVILVILFAILAIASPGYRSLHSVSSTVQLAAILGIMAGGQTLVLLTAGVDLSVASVASAAAYVMAQNSSHGAATAIVIGLGIGLLAGLVNGIGVGIFGVQPLIMTLGIGGIAGGMLLVYSQAETNGAPVVPQPVYELGTGTVLRYIPLDVLIVWLPLSVILILGLKYSGLGRAIVAVGDNPVACRLAGVRTWQVLLATYVISGLLSATAGIILGGNNNAVDLQLASSYLLLTVAAAVIGGTSVFGGSGGYAGTIFGALILTVLDAFLTVINASEAARQMLYGALILLLAWLYARLSGGA
ncbi:MAG: ABC transporter permease [Chloroflexota bacterium]|nr:MAG: ABC transporter permease [Chloroflexota bacterium]